jgi:hypothetical protein
VIGAYHPRHLPIPDGWQYSAELPGFHAQRYIWIEPMADDPTNPDYYRQGGIETADFIAAKRLDFFEGNAVKYLTRWRQKGGVEDLKKARWYINKLVELHDETE